MSRPASEIEAKARELLATDEQRLADLHAMFLWAQGPLQALLPHEVLVGFQLTDEQLRYNATR